MRLRQDSSVYLNNNYYYLSLNTDHYSLSFTSQECHQKYLIM